MHHCVTLILCLATLGLFTQQSAATVPLEQVPTQLREKSFFTDRIATALIEFDSEVEAPEDWAKQVDGFRILAIEVQPNSRTNPPSSVARIRFLPTRTGILTLASFNFHSETRHYQSEPIQLVVQEPQRSEQMSLQLTPEKLTVYAGEPLRIDLAWHSSIHAAALKHLKLFPDYFNNPDIKILIPRNTAPEARQVGLPIGGRRVIATRTLIKGNDDALGTIKLPLYFRFNTPGTYTLPSTRLECAVLEKADQSFARYAAHFNNSFFESVDPNEAYARSYTTAPEIQIEVVPLPIDSETAPFTGLFQPLSIKVSASPTELKIGQLIELKLKAISPAPHGMLELPPLSQQPGLRERFVVDNQYGTLWQADGSLFSTRLRPLATATTAIPSLHFRTFNPKTGQFETIQTKPIPLTLHPSQGQTFIPLSTFDAAAVNLSQQALGIWNNLEKNPMNDTLNLITHLLSHFFWPLLCLSPIVFLLVLPIVHERRRRALHPEYARQVSAYKAFKKIAADSPQKWPAFLRFMAISFGSQEKAWTRGDSERALQKLGADKATIQNLSQMHTAADAQAYSQESRTPEFKNLNQLAQKIVRLCGKLTLVLCLLSLCLTPRSEANEWNEAETSFAQAQAAPVGSDEAIADYKIAALKFQNLAATLQHGGEAWVNAGNAWFQAGEIGRAIAAYRNAQAQRPFDSQLAASLTTARASALNEVLDTRSWLQKTPSTWLKIGTLLINASFWLSLLFAFRYRSQATIISSSALMICLLLSSSYLAIRSKQTQPAGTIIVDSVYAKKGPSYAYTNAFNEPLHDGLECTLLTTRDDWHQILLHDDRRCWIPSSTLQVITN